MPDHKQLTFPLAVKSTSDAGTFEGMLSTYSGNPDLGNDIVLPGAFKEMHLTADGKIRILDSHNTRAPVGKGKLTDTATGLHINGQLDLGVARARELLSLMKNGIISGLSIGYDILTDGSEIRADGVRLLKRLKLWEASLVTFPMNPDAQITAVKRLPGTIGEWEAALRTLGVSKRKARAMARHDWPILKGPEPEVDAAELIELFKSISPER